MELALSGSHPRLLPHLLSPQRPRLLLPNPGHGPQALHPSQPDATPTREDPEASPSPCARPRRPSGLPLFLGAPPPARETPAPYPSPPVCPSRPRCSALPPTTRGIGVFCAHLLSAPRAIGEPCPLPMEATGPATCPRPAPRLLPCRGLHAGLGALLRRLRPSLPSRASAPDAPTEVRIKDGRDTRSTRQTGGSDTMRTASSLIKSGVSGGVSWKLNCAKHALMDCRRAEPAVKPA